MAYRSVLPTRKDALATRGRLVRAALELFTTDGYRGTTTLELAARARTAEATIYRHFRGKDALYNEALREALRFGVGLLRPGEGERDALCRDRLDRLARGLVHRTATDASLVLMLLRRGVAPALDEANLQLTREFRELLAQIIAGGKQEGRVRAGSADLWASVWLALVAFAVDRVAAREWSAEHPNVGQTLDAAWDAIAHRSVSAAPA
ncbi:MAG: TetR/AcrR family transcriptional regulator [Gemmatimonadales bacterium]